LLPMTRILVGRPSKSSSPAMSATHAPCGPACRRQARRGPVRAAAGIGAVLDPSAQVARDCANASRAASAPVPDLTVVGSGGH